MKTLFKILGAVYQTSNINMRSGIFRLNTCKNLLNIFSSRAITVTLAPFRAHSTAKHSPIPLLPPVTTTCLSTMLLGRLRVTNIYTNTCAKTANPMYKAISQVIKTVMTPLCGFISNW